MGGTDTAIDQRAKEIQEEFFETFGVKPLIAYAPGRINFIGEHTDYNNGFVLPAAINRYCLVAIAPSGSDDCTLVASDLNESFGFSLGEDLQASPVFWSNYFVGVTAGFMQKGALLQGFNMMFNSDVPLGAGLSSSAALETAFGTALNALFDLGFDKMDIAKTGQSAEHHYVGVKCGLMDQFASCMGKKNHAVLLDCKSLEYDSFPIHFPNHEIVLFDTRVKHNLAGSEYNLRREQCEAGVRAIQMNHSAVNSLRDASLDQLEEVKNSITDKEYNRCKYVIEENDRVIKATEALKRNDLDSFGGLMNETHIGLRDLYEVSCDELDRLFELASSSPSVKGARMMGGGFGGCTINIIERKNAEQVIADLSTVYRKQFGKELKVYRFEISDGAAVI